MKIPKKAINLAFLTLFGAGSLFNCNFENSIKIKGKVVAEERKNIGISAEKRWMNIYHIRDRKGNYFIGALDAEKGDPFNKGDCAIINLEGKSLGYLNLRQLKNSSLLKGGRIYLIKDYKKCYCSKFYKQKGFK